MGKWERGGWGEGLTGTAVLADDGRVAAWTGLHGACDGTTDDDNLGAVTCDGGGVLG